MDLKKIKEALDKGEKTEYADHYDEILKRADGMSGSIADKSLNKKIKESGEKERANKEDLDELNEEYAQMLENIQKENENLAKQAEIENLKNHIESLKKEKEDKMIEIENKYNDIIDKLIIKLDNIIKE